MAMIVDLSKRWMEDESMACLRKNPEMFFPPNGTHSITNPSAKMEAQWKRAKAVCATCPVIKQCARDNLGEIEGVWGGMDPAERARQRSHHGYYIRNLEGRRKEEYARLAHMLRVERRLPFADVGRIMGFSHVTAQYLYDWWKAYLLRQSEGVTDLQLPSPEDEVIELHPNAQFPAKPPMEGDGWVRVGRRVSWGNYLGQTEDDAWFYMKVRLLGTEYSICWIKVEDVQLTREVTRNVLTRVGNGSRIYGTTLSRRGTSQAG